MSRTKNDCAWNSLFKKYEILNRISLEGFYYIKSSRINQFRESRLMTKFDYKSQLPEIFANNNLSILPVSRGSYIISDFETFKDFESNEKNITKINFPYYLKSIDFNNITSESTALHCAYISGMIERFVNDEELKPTISGRMSSLAFNFNINRKKNSPLNVKVNSAQIEIDGGYEGVESLNLIEAKNLISKDFLVRQLFYPYKLWSNKMTKKRVRSLFLTYSNGIFHFREYGFEDPDHYNSLRLVQEKKYSIRTDGVVSIEFIRKILYETKVVKEPHIPFPQADLFERVINLCELLKVNKKLSRDYITDNYDFNIRQTVYYTDAGRYLSLIDKKEDAEGIIYFLTQNGKELFNLSIIDRQKKFIELILSHLVFNSVLKVYLEKMKAPLKSQVMEIMKRSKIYNVNSASTLKRRSSTVLSWSNWILDQVE